MIAANGATEDELAAIASALSLVLCHPERSEAKSRDEGPTQSPWLLAVRREAIGLD